ncbi:MAG: STM3941 family protein [Xanthomarina sp.]
MKNNEIIIETSKVKMLGLIGISLLFVVLGIHMVFNGLTIEIEFLKNYIRSIIMGFLSIVFFGFIGMIMTKKIIKNKYGIKINDDGIYDNSTAISSGLIEWNNIQKIKIFKFGNQKFIQIIVNNPNHFVERQTNFFIRKIVEINFKKFDSPIQISTNGLKIGFYELYILMTDELNKRK